MENETSEESMVVNLSSYILSDSQITLQSRGLSFAPTNNFDVYRTLLDVNRLAKHLTLKSHFLVIQQAMI